MAKFSFPFLFHPSLDTHRDKNRFNYHKLNAIMCNVEHVVVRCNSEKLFTNRHGTLSLSLTRTQGSVEQKRSAKKKQIQSIEWIWACSSVVCAGKRE